MPLNLVSEIQRAAQSGPVVRVGRVAVINATTVDVDYGGSIVPQLRRLTSYTPTVNDVVIVLISGGHSIVLGKTA